MRPLSRQPFRARTTEELLALLSAVANAILAVIIISMLYFGRDIFVPVALAILLSFVLAPLVGLLQRIPVVPRGLAVVSVVILAFSLIFAMGSLLATQLTQLAWVETSAQTSLRNHHEQRRTAWDLTRAMARRERESEAWRK